MGTAEGVPGLPGMGMGYPANGLGGMPNGLPLGGGADGGGGAERPTDGMPLQKPHTLQNTPLNGAPQRLQYDG